MPSDMRLQCPSEDTPPSTRPPSVASSGGTSGTPHRSTSMDSLHTNSSVSDKPTGEEFIPTRLVRALPKANANAMQFVKTGPAMLHKSAKEQMKKAEVVKSLRKTSLQEQEEEEWQKKSSTPPVTNLKSFGDDDTDWQSNLDKWKSNRRKRNEDVLERVIEVKKNELDDEFSRRRSAIREDKNRKGRRYNMLVVHDDDDSNDLSDLLGFTSTTKETTGTSLNTRSTGDSHHPSTVEEGEANKSDAGFCTGSSDDTGSDGGVFAEDNISDTSSALGDKREVHDSLLDSGSSSAQRKEDSSCDELIINGHHHVNGTMTTTSAKVANAVIVGGKGGEYTYDKAIEDYRQFAENSVKKRTSSVTSLSSNASGSKDDQDNNNIKSSSSSPIGKKIEDKLSYFDGGGSAAKEPRVVKRDKTTAKIDIDKRRSMFELRDIDKQQRQDNSLTNSSYTRRPDLYYRRSVDANSNTGSVQSLRNKVASFENISASSIDLRHKGTSATPVRDSKFKEKLANFSQIEKGDVGGGVSPTRRKTPQKDQNFYEKLKNFTQIEATNGGRDGRGGSLPRNLSPEQCYPPNSAKKTLSMRLSAERTYDRRGSNAPPPMPLKDRIASFENLAPAGAPSSSVGSRKEFSVSMENLNKGSWGAGGHTLQSSQSATNLFRRSAPPPSTPFMVVEVDEEAAATTTTTTSTSAEEETCVKRTITRSYGIKNTIENLESKEKKNGDSPLSIKKVPPPPPPLPEKHRSRALPETPASRDTSPAGSRARILPEVPSKTSYEVPLSRSLPGTPSVSKPLLDFPKPRTLPETPMPRRESPRLLPETPRTQPDILEMNSEISPVGESSKSNEGSVLDRLPDLAPPSPTPPPSGLPPPIPPPSVPSYEEDKSLEAPSLEKTDCLYGDQDIDEVIGNCPSLPEFSTKSDPNNLNPSVPSNERNTEISSYAFEELPANDSGFEVPKKEDPPVMKGDSSNQQVRKTPDSPSPSKDSIANNNFPVLEVLDVTWTEDKSSSPALPPSVPPPPPPPEEEEEEGEERCNDVGADDQTLTKAAVTPLLSPTAVATEKEAWKATSSPLSSPQTTKQELRKRMSDFLGTQPKAEEAVTLQPPPDLSELLRQERDAERQIVQKQQQLYLSRDSPVPDSSLHSCLGSPLSPTRPKYTWEDRMKADDTKTGRHDDLNESSDTLEFHTKLAELEQEMEKHDREMLQRIKVSGGEEPTEKGTARETSSSRSTYTESSVNQTQETQIRQEEDSTYYQTRKVNDVAAVSPSSSVEPSKGGGHEFSAVPMKTRAEPIEQKYEGNDPRQERPVNEYNAVPRDTSNIPPPIPRKQSILALSAIPKPKLTDNDSWIMKRKAEISKKDYNKHWLIQEAEQRRLEQQERISRPSQLPLAKQPPPPNTPLQTTPGYQSHFQNLKSSFHGSSSSTTSSHLHSPSGVGGPFPNGPLNPSLMPNRANTAYSNGTAYSPTDSSYKYNGGHFIGNGNKVPPNSNWMKQTKTYQPAPEQPSAPSSSKPLPDAIINSLTQRVSNKMNGSNNINNNNNNNNNTISRSSGYSGSVSSSYRSDDNYHDYMNSENLSPNHNGPVLTPSVAPQTTGGGPLPSSGSPSGLLSEEQRLLSVSGKKKCSHCGEELGRGAAMIIESLRLFYHIPCFKCCVCGIQLGNGTSGADVRVRNHKLHCHNCYSNDEGMKFSKV